MITEGDKLISENAYMFSAELILNDSDFLSVESCRNSGGRGTKRPKRSSAQQAAGRHELKNVLYIPCSTETNNYHHY